MLLGQLNLLTTYAQNAEPVTLQCLEHQEWI